MRKIPEAYHGVEGHLKMVEAEYLYNAPFRLGDGYYANLGTMYGRSAVHLAGGIKESGVGGLVFTVDTKDRNVEPTLTEKGVRTFVVCLHMDSAKSASIFQNASFKLVFIDADHSYKGVRADFEAWESRVASDGEVAFHDTNTEGVGRFLKELEEEGKWVKVGQAHTLSWWKRCEQ